MIRSKESDDMNKPQNTPPIHTSKLCNSFKELDEHILRWTHSLRDRLRPFVKPTIYTFIILLLTTLAIWRTNLPYGDDFGRDYNGGYAFDYAFARHSPSILMYILNMDFTLQNLSPLTQILAMLLVAVTCVIITYFICERRIKYLPLTLSTLIAINPFSLGFWVFQYDSPGMAMSILFATLPIVYWYRLDDIFGKNLSAKRKNLLIIKFITLSTISLLIMWTSYQSTSGLLPLLITSIGLVNILHKASPKKTFIKAALYVIPYLLAAGLFLVIYTLSSTSNYRDASAANISNMFTAIANNVSIYLGTAWKYLNNSWRITILLIALIFIIISALSAKGLRHTVRNGLLAVMYLMVSLPLSYGAYLLLNSPASAGASRIFGRTAVGLGFVLALVCIISVTEIINSKKKCHIIYLMCIPGISIFIAFVSFCTAFGNAYDDQLRYLQFRAEELITDIAQVYNYDVELNKKNITLYDTIGYSGEMAKLVKAHPATQLIVEDMEKWLSPIYFGKMYNFSSNISWKQPKFYKNDCMDYRATGATYYHTIREKDNGDICVYLK